MKKCEGSQGECGVEGLACDSSVIFVVQMAVRFFYDFGKRQVGEFVRRERRKP